MKKRNTLILLFLSLSLFTLSAEDITSETNFGVELAYYFDDHEGYDNNQVGGFIGPNYSPVDAPGGFVPASGDTARTIGTGWGSAEFQAFLSHTINIPALVGDDLMADNKLQINGSFYLSPISAYLSSYFNLTPIAFLNFEIGGLLGTGWNASLFSGLGLNENGVINETSFPGIVGEFYGAATLQFDLAALVPGDWNHLVMAANAKFLYKGFSAASDQQPWLWLADIGQNLNGWNYYGTYAIGYQMPLALDFIGFLVVTKEMLGSNRTSSTMDSGGWGSDFVEVTFGPVTNFQLGGPHSLLMLVQFQSRPDYTDATIFNTYYQNRSFEGIYVELYRIAFQYSMKL